MLHLKVKHKLLTIWLGSIVVALTLMMGLFQYQIGILHEQNAQSSIAEAFASLQSELKTLTRRVHDSADALVIRDDVIAALSMITRYQDRKNYSPAVFDPEKRRLAQELRHHAEATGMDLLMLRDAAGDLAAFYISPDVGGRGAGYIVFEDNRPYSVMASDPGMREEGIPEIAQFIQQREADALKHQSTLDHDVDELVLLPNEELALIDYDNVVRTRANGDKNLVGRLSTVRVLGATFITALSNQSGLELHIVHEGGSTPSPAMGVSTAALLDKSVPVMELTSASKPDHVVLSADQHFVGVLQMRLLGEKHAALAFLQRKDDLESTLTTFQNVVLAVLVFSFVAIVPMGIFFFNRAISRPVDQLMACAATIREGDHEDLPIPEGDDEFSELAHAFQDMAQAVHAREQALKNSQTSLKKAQHIAKLGNWDLDVKTGSIACSEASHAIMGTVPGDVQGYLDLFMELSLIHI